MGEAIHEEAKNFPAPTWKTLKCWRSSYLYRDLNEYNILVAHAFQVDNPRFALWRDIKQATRSSHRLSLDRRSTVRHPEASSLLFRELTRIRTFFVKQGVKALNIDDATQFVVDKDDYSDCCVSKLIGDYKH